MPFLYYYNYILNSMVRTKFHNLFHFAFLANSFWNPIRMRATKLLLIKRVNILFQVKFFEKIECFVNAVFSENCTALIIILNQTVLFYICTETYTYIYCFNDILYTYIRYLTSNMFFNFLKIACAVKHFLQKRLNHVKNSINNTLFFQKTPFKTQNPTMVHKYITSHYLPSKSNTLTPNHRSLSQLIKKVTCW